MLKLALELITVLCFVLVTAHAVRRGRLAALLLPSMVVLGFARENYVTLERLLYGYGDLHLHLGAAPLIGSIIWPYSIYVALCWAEHLTGRRLEEARLSPALLAGVGLFMMSLVGFYEPLLERADMARWQEGTRASWGAPWIAFIGYSTLAVSFIALFQLILGGERRPRGGRIAAVFAAAVVLAFAHARGLQALKDLLGW